MVLVPGESPIRLPAQRRREGSNLSTNELPDGSWTINDAFIGAVHSELITKLPPYPGPSAVNRVSWIPVPVQVTSVPPGTDNVIVEFGYDPNFYCSSRREACVANASTIQTGNSVFTYETSDGPTADSAGASGCTVAIPALSQRVMWYQIDYRNASGQTILTRKVEPLVELMSAVDTFMPEPIREIDKPFLMPIEDVFTITGRGTVVTGRVERGQVKVGEEIEIIGLRPTTKTTCTGVEMFRKLLDEGRAGDNIGALPARHEEGRCGARPGPRQAGEHHAAHGFHGAGVHLDQGGGWPAHAVLHELPPAVLFPDDGCDGTVALPEGTEMVMPGDNTEMTVELGKPIAMDEGLRFAIREGGRTVGSGRVVKIVS